MRTLADLFLPRHEDDRRIALRFAFVLAALAIALMSFLIFTGGDWAGAVAKMEAAGRKVKVEHLVKTWTWRGGLVDLALIAGLLITLRFWTRSPAREESTLPSTQSRSGRFTLFLVVSLCAAALIRIPRLDFGFYNDEAYTYQRLIVGEFKPEPSGSGKFTWLPVKWMNTVWFNASGNNSQPYSILSRLSYDGWQSVTGATAGQVCETAMRLPALLFGMASLFLLALMMHEVAGHWAAVWTTIAGVLHGWHIRYSTEARPYSLMIFAVVLMMWCLHRALRFGRWRDWLGYALGLFLCAWSFNGSVYFLATLNGMLLVRQAWLWRKKELPPERVLRPVIAGVLATLPAIPLMLPLLPQLMRVLETFTAIRGQMGVAWWQDITGFLFFGCPWNDFDAANPYNLAIARFLVSHPLLWIPVAALFTVSLAGFARLIKAGGAMRLFTLAVPISILLAWFLMGRKGNFINHWYVLYALPWVLCNLGTGIAHLGSVGPPFRTALTALIALLTLALPASVGWSFRSHGKQDERAPVLAVRGGIYPHYESSPAALERLYGCFWNNNNIYDPRAVIIGDTSTLESLVQKARRETRPLFVGYSHRGMALQSSAEVLRRIEESGEFEKVDTFFGLEQEQFTQHLWKLRQVGGKP